MAKRKGQSKYDQRPAGPQPNRRLPEGQCTHVFGNCASVTYNLGMVFIETPVFTKLIEQLLTHEDYVELQRSLLLKPDVGPVIPGSGGLRKVRWGLQQQGKRGGLRVIYYWDKPNETIYMLLVYRKNEREDLTPNQVKFLRQLIKEYLE